MTPSLIKYQMILDGVLVFNKNLRPHDNNLINQADDYGWSTMVDQMYIIFYIDILVDKDLVIKVKLSKYFKFDSFLDAEFSFCTVWSICRLI